MTLETKDKREDTIGKSPTIEKNTGRFYRHEMTITLTVTGMSCEHCEQTVTEALESIEGVTSATADNEANEAVVEGNAPIDDLVAAVEDAGYEASA